MSGCSDTGNLTIQLCFYIITFAVDRELSVGGWGEIYTLSRLKASLSLHCMSSLFFSFLPG